jgi:hypothetical protein
MRQQLACRTRIEVNGFFSFVLHDHRITAIGQWPEPADSVDIQDVSGTDQAASRSWPTYIRLSAMLGLPLPPRPVEA